METDETKNDQIDSKAFLEFENFTKFFEVRY